MMRLFDYLFYRLYIFYKKKGEEEVLGPSLFVAVCLGCLLAPTCWIVRRLFFEGSNGRTVLIVFAVIVGLWSYIRYKKRKDKILSQFQDSPCNRKIHIFFIYLMIPVCTLTGVLIGEILEKFAAL